MTLEITVFALLTDAHDLKYLLFCRLFSKSFGWSFGQFNVKDYLTVLFAVINQLKYRTLNGMLYLFFLNNVRPLLLNINLSGNTCFVSEKISI